MSLIDRIFHDDDPADPEGLRHINNHALSGAVWFWATGKITRAQVVSSFNMTAEDEVQLDQIEAHYIALPADEKRSFHSDMDAAGTLVDCQKLTKPQYRALLGLT